jgi:glutaminyl-peptide cyclotransferase
MMQEQRLLLAVAIVLVFVEPYSSSSSAQRTTPIDTVRVVKTYPHDPTAFTQGLIYLDGFLFESTGLRGHSSLRKVQLKTGRVVQERRLDRAYFGEGLAALNGQLVQLTWRSNVAFVYNPGSFGVRSTFPYAGEGWGLTHEGSALVLSDGSANLRYLDPETFVERRRITVTDGGVPVSRLNELEYIDGEIYANVWHSNRIARIDPRSGQVRRWIDLRDLLGLITQRNPEAVPNGIAYDPAGMRLFVTGKLWPRLFEIEIVAEDADVGLVEN